MAYKKNRWRRARAWGGRRYAGMRSRWAGRKRGMGYILGLPLAFVIGFVVGLSNLDNYLPADIVLLGAVLPLSKLGRGLWQISSFSQGVILGNMVQKWTGFTLPLTPGSAAGKTVSGGGW